MHIPITPINNIENNGLDFLSVLDKEHSSKAPIDITIPTNRENITPPLHIIPKRHGIPITLTNVRDLLLF